MSDGPGNGDRHVRLRAALAAGVRLELFTREASEAVLDLAQQAVPPTSEVARWLGISETACAALLDAATTLPLDATVPDIRESFTSRLTSASQALTPRTIGMDDAGSSSPTLLTGPALTRPNLPDRLGPYRLLEELGHGGMGVVYRARHETLGTTCAVKVLIAGEHASPEAIARFQREAAAVARLGRHPNIVSVFDLACEGGLLYYAMELIDGRPLTRVLREKRLSPGDAARLVQRVARALHFAHEQGVIHRDVKPDNILVRADGEPFVMDFGLAHELGSSGRLSAQGQLLGTPQYMAPEQISGLPQLVDARTDVYGLGTVLYEALTGVLAHPAESAISAFAIIVSGDIIPPRKVRPEVPLDLDTICMKCLATDSGRRYPTAEALADDLARFLRWEPILARPVSRLERLVRRMRRNPLATALSAALVIAALSVGGLAWRSARQEAASEARHRELVDAYLRELGQRGRAAVDAALARRAVGDVGRSRAYAGSLHATVDELIRLAPALAEPWYLRGCLQRAQGLAVEAEGSQDRAVKLASRTDATAGSHAVLALACYERGTLRAERYQRLLAERRAEVLRQRADEPTPPPVPTPKEVEETFPELVALRSDAIADLEEVGRMGLRGADVWEANSRAKEALARGVLAMLTGAEDAEERLREAVDADPFLTEAYEALAALAEGKGEWVEAEEWCERGRSTDRGYLPHLTRLLDLLCARSVREDGRGVDSTPTRERALAAVEEGLRLDAARADLWAQKSWFHCAEAEARRFRGADAEEALQAAIEAGTKAVSLDTDSGEAWHHLGSAHNEQAAWMSANGKDPTEPLGRAVNELEEAVRLRPDLVSARVNLGLAHTALAERLAWRGGDPLEAYQRAIEVFEGALAVNPRTMSARCDLGIVYMARARWRMSAGADPRGDLALARETYGKALAVAPRSIKVINNRANVDRTLADWLLAHGEDPTEAYTAALAGYDKAMAINPRYALGEQNRGLVHKGMGDWQRIQGRDPTAELRKAFERFDAALGLNPRFTDAAVDAATAWRSLGAWQAAHDEDPRESLGRARALFEKALSIDGESLAASNNLGLVYQDEAAWAAEQGEDPRPFVERSLECFDKAVSIHPRSRPALHNRARSLRRMGDLQRDRGEEPTTTYERAVSDEEAALAVDPANADVMAGLAQSCLLLARARTAAAARDGVDPDEAGRLRGLAIDALERAIESGLPKPNRLLRDPSFEGLHADPRWKEIEEEAGAMR